LQGTGVENPTGQGEAMKQVDPARRTTTPITGIYVLAMHNGAWIAADIAELDTASLLEWLRGDTLLAEAVVATLLGHSAEEIDAARGELGRESIPRPAQG
jgi:hypothetical protein